jgi:hypothetical protein
MKPSQGHPSDLNAAAILGPAYAEPFGAVARW